MIQFQRTRNLLREFKFQDVFRELGWANPPKIPAPEFQVDGARYRFTPIAEQGGLHAFEVSDLTDGVIPPRAAQRALKRQLTPLFAEHFLVFVNRARSSSLWLWVRRDGDTRKPVDCRFDRMQTGELLLQKLSGLYFDYDDLDDEGKTSIGQVLDRLNANFYAEKVTKRFYEEFRAYKDRFIKFIEGIESLDNQRWYASVILNRLMFIYFIQQKRFLSNDPEYLQNKFDHCEDSGLNYHRDFLCPLFFKGFALRADERDAATNKLLGTVPYLDGGLFLEHPHLEADGKLEKIRIENAAFKRLLAFFGEYNWHLDERPLRQGNEINPDVLGYIFEKYINQKQMGRITRRRISPNTSARAPSSRSSSTPLPASARPRSPATTPCGNFCNSIPTATSTTPSRKALNFRCRKKSRPASRTFPSATAGTSLREKNSRCRRKSGARSSPGGNVILNCVQG